MHGTELVRNCGVELQRRERDSSDSRLFGRYPCETRRGDWPYFSPMYIDDLSAAESTGLILWSLLGLAHSK
jgi:hypothetical protein